MTAKGHDSDKYAAHSGLFPETHWSVVLSAGQQNSPHAAAALEQLCRAYWYPLYAYIRRKGYSPEDSQDLTQEFFARFLSSNYLAGVDPRRGRLRSYLLGALNHFLSDSWDREHRMKRASAQKTLPIDGRSVEILYTKELVDELSPDRLYDRHWALALLEHVLSQLRQEYQTSGKPRLFEMLRGFLTAEAGPDAYHRIASEFGMTEGAVRVAIHRLRKRYGVLIMDEVSQTVSSSEEIRGEIQYLLAALSG